jgi:protease secretion system outer membrane protein
VSVSIQARLVKKALATGVCLALAAASGSAGAISLVQAYDAALRNDATYRAAYFENEGNKEYRVLGRSNLLPTVQANASVSNNRADITAPNFLGNLSTSHPAYVSNSKSIQLRQPLFNLDAYARYKQGNAQADYSEANFEGRKQDLVLRVVGTYTDALFASEQLELALAQRDAYREQAAANKHLFEKGEGTRTDMLETQARLDVAEAFVIEAQENVRAALITLSGVVGQEVANVDGLGPDFQARPLQPASFDEWKALALKNNPDLRAQEFAIEAAKQEVLKARAGHAPRLDFFAAYSNSKSETLTTLNQDQTVRSVGLQLNIPIYAGGAVNASARQAVANTERARAELDSRRDKLLVEVGKQYGLALAGAQRTAALLNAVNSSKELVTATSKSIKGGIRINLDLLNAQQQLFQNQRDLAQARFGYIASVLRLRAAAGTLTGADLREVATYFR